MDWRSRGLGSSGAGSIQCYLNPFAFVQNIWVWHRIFPSWSVLIICKMVWGSMMSFVPWQKAYKKSSWESLGPKGLKLNRGPTRSRSWSHRQSKSLHSISSTAPSFTGGWMVRIPTLLGGSKSWIPWRQTASRNGHWMEGLSPHILDGGRFTRGKKCSVPSSSRSWAQWSSLMMKKTWTHWIKWKWWCKWCKTVTFSNVICIKNEIEFCYNKNELTFLWL